MTTKTKETPEVPATEDSTEEVSVPERTEPMTVGPSEGGNAVLAAWRGLGPLFGARAERFDVSGDGVVVVNLTFDNEILTDPAINVSAEQIVNDLAFRSGKLVERRLDLLDLIGYVNHPEIDPESFTDSNAMTLWMVNHLKGAGEGDGSRSPDYAKNAISRHKNANGIAAPRGRRRRILRIEELGELKPETLSGVKLTELEALRATIDQAILTQSSSTIVTQSDAAHEAVAEAASA